jgi:hypothetical protein
MNKTIFLVCATLAIIFFVGCQQAQEGTPAGVSYISVDQIKSNESSAVPPVPDLVENQTAIPPVPESSAVEEGNEPVITVENETVEDSTPVVAPVEQASPKEIVIIAKETDLINLKPVASDPDKDTLKFTYSTPLNDLGQWQTTYGDAGQYTVTITASDGELTTSKDALLIVNKKEESPTIDSHSPIELTMAINENTKIDFAIKASDLNKDPLTYVWKLDGQEVSTTDAYNYFGDYDSAGSHTVKVDVSDGTSTTSLIWSVTVINVDRPPVLKPIPDITVKETETITITPEATDPDKEDTVTYKLEWPGGMNATFDGKTGVWYTTYDDSGVYTVNVTATDGTLSDTQQVKITVINVNRAPVIENIVQVQ